MLTTAALELLAHAFERLDERTRDAQESEVRAAIAHIAARFA